MVVVNLDGGLGNQMFNYAFAKFLQHNGCKVVLDISRFSKNTSIGGGGN